MDAHPYLRATERICPISGVLMMVTSFKLLSLSLDIFEKNLLVNNGGGNVM